MHSEIRVLYSRYRERSGAHKTEYVSNDEVKSRGNPERAAARQRRDGVQLEVPHGLLHPACREGNREREDRHRRLDRGERARYEKEEPPERAERDEAVEVPRWVVRERPTLPFELVRPGALFLPSVFVRLRRHNWV
jgi:hypothetical protein